MDSFEPLGIEPTVTYDEAKNNWIAHFEERPHVIANVRRPSQEEAWAVIYRTEAPQATPQEIFKRIADQMAKASRKAIEEG